MSELGLPLISFHTVSACLNNASLALMQFSCYLKNAQMFFIGFRLGDKVHQKVTVIFFYCLISFKLIHFLNWQSVM